MKKYKLREKIVFEFKNDYVQFVPSKKVKWNWFSYHFAYIYFERDVMAGPAYEFWFYILGLGFYVRYNTDKAMRLYDKWMRGINKGDIYEIVKKNKNVKTKKSTKRNSK
jgi:hypothetical protein